MIDLKTMLSHRNLPKGGLAARTLALFAPGLSAVPLPEPVEGDRRSGSQSRSPIALEGEAMRESARIRTRVLRIDARAIALAKDNSSRVNPPPTSLLGRLIGRLAWGVVISLAVVVTVSNNRQRGVPEQYW